MEINVSMISTTKVLFKGKAKSVILPGEEGIFEIAPFHKRIMSRLISGTLIIDEQSFDIRRGIAKVINNIVTILIEEK